MSRCNEIIQDVIDTTHRRQPVDTTFKKNSATNKIPVVLFSATGCLKDVAKSCKADGFIQKPSDINILAKVVDDKA